MLFTDTFDNKLWPDPCQFSMRFGPLPYIEIWPFTLQKSQNSSRYASQFVIDAIIFPIFIRRDGHEFMWNEHHGFILTCPSNLGTGMRAGVHVKLPLLGEKVFSPGKSCFVADTQL